MISAHPVPFVGYTTDTTPSAIYGGRPEVRVYAGRDVLVYETEPLTEDVTVAGPVRSEAGRWLRAERIRILW